MAVILEEASQAQDSEDPQRGTGAMVQRKNGSSQPWGRPYKADRIQDVQFC